jgi:MerR family transcriptional regulator, redox-sensitive transcriptional activator SoxR
MGSSIQFWYRERYQLKSTSSQGECCVVGMTIGEVARRAELRPSAIRYYEKLGLLPRPPRQGGQRRYDPHVLERLAIVRFAKFVGFTIGEIRLLLDGAPDRPPPQRWRQIAEQKVLQVDTFITEAIAVRALLQTTLRQKCPKLVERGLELAESATSHRRTRTPR